MLIFNDLLCEIQGIICDHPESEYLLVGDLNSDLSDSKSNIMNDALNTFFSFNRLHRCDILFPVGNTATYVNDSLNCSSAIDYICYRLARAVQ